MKIAYLTAGAGQMFCGSCLRDNTLARALRDAGHDVLLIPCYTPTRTDEPNASGPRVFLGGINMYLQQHLAFFRRTPRLLDRLFDTPALLRLATRFGVSVDPHDLGAMTLSMLQGPDGLQRKEVATLAAFIAEEAPDIVTIPNSMLSGLAPALKAAVKAPICCAFQGEELFLDSLGEPYRGKCIATIRQQARFIDRFVAVSRFGADFMAKYLGIERSRIDVVPLGITFDGHASRGGPDPDPFTIGYLARIAPEKGLHVLCEAFRQLAGDRSLPPVRLVAAGYLGPENREYLARIQVQMTEWGLADRFEYRGELDRAGKLAHLQGLSVLSVPGDYEDPKGLFLLESLASGVPVVQPKRGAAIEIVETPGGGLLTAPRDPAALAEGIRRLIRNPDERRVLADRGYAGVRAHYSAAQMRDRAVEVFSSLVGRTPAAEAGRA
jgi:glycosyltransferase involved in cell wall biosynthesis